MCIFGLGQQKRGGGFTPGETKQIETDADLPEVKDLQDPSGAELALGSKSSKKPAVDETGTATPTGAAALAINPTQSTGINTQA